MKLVTVIGARPQFIKAAPVSRALGSTGVIDECIVHTGQHYDDQMSGVFFEELGLSVPTVNLSVRESTHARMTGAMTIGIEDVLLDRKPDAVLIYGDTNSTLAGALAAAKLDIPILHVEAGLRSFRRSQPEEINRTVADHLSSMLFCPTAAAIANLRREGVDQIILHTGDVMYDASLAAATNPAGAGILDRMRLTPGAYAVATLHRAENTDNAPRLEALLRYLVQTANGLPVIVPLHPRTKKATDQFGLSLDGLTVTNPLGYLEMTHLVKSSALVMTDSGGLQKEAYFHQVPCITLRDETEWVETIDAGWNRLWTTPNWLPRQSISDYGDGHASEVIAQAIARQYA